jgi:hypothetical protein
MMKLSTGQPSTLKSYRQLVAVVFPKALPMLDKRIEAFGEDEPVLQAESQMIYLFAQIEFKDAPEFPDVIFCQTEINRAYKIDKSYKEDV